MAITAKDVMELRKQTDCGMMECKKALTEADGNFEKAIEILRERGLATAAKKASRVAAEGMVYADYCPECKVGVVIEVNSETDFVANNATFREFVKGILRTILAGRPANVEALLALPFDGTDSTVDAEVKNKIFAIGENITIRRFEIIEGVTGTYIHGNCSSGVVTKFETTGGIESKPEFAELAKNICMQITAMAPTYVCKTQVPQSVVDNEKEILLTQIKNDPKSANKPEAIIAKMVEGRVSKFYDTACLLEQQYVKDDDLKVGKYVENTAKALGGEIKVVSFVSYERGEGLEKREDDFAAEIDKLVNGK